jgi:hypothetical protein
MQAVPVTTAMQVIPVTAAMQAVPVAAAIEEKSLASLKLATADVGVGMSVYI